MDVKQIIRAMAETAERSAGSSKEVMRLRVWRQIDEISRLAGVDVDIGKLKAQIAQDIDREKKSNKGRQRRNDYNEPPQKLKAQFERTARTTLVKGTKKSAPSQVRYELQGPIERYKTDLTSGERSSLERFVSNYCEAQRSVSVTASYSPAAGAGGKGAPGGGVRDSARLAYTDVLHVLSVTFGGHPQLRRVAEGLAVGDMTAEQAGRIMFPHVKDKQNLRMAGRTTIKLMGILLEMRESREIAMRRGAINSPHNLERTITQEIRARRGR